MAHSYIHLVDGSIAASRRQRSRSRGMGLIETALAIVIVAVGAVAVMQFMASATSANAQLNELTTGMTLASSAMEYATDQDFATVEGWLTSAPSFPTTGQPYLANATGPGPEQQGWKQVFSAERRQLANLKRASNDPADTCVRVMVTVSKGDRVIYTASRWFTKAP